MFSILSIALSIVKYMYLFIQCTPSIDQLHFINSMLSIYPRCAPIHPMHSIHRSTALHPFNALHLPKMYPQPSNALHSPFHGISWILRKRERKMLCEQGSLCLFLFGLNFHQFLVDLRIKMRKSGVFWEPFLNVRFCKKI